MAFEYNYPSDLIAYVKSTPALAEMVRSGAGASAIFEGMRKIIPEKDFLPIVRKMALQAIYTAFSGENARVKRLIKDGLDVDTILPSSHVAELRDLRETLDATTANCTREFLSSVTSFLTRWMMPNGLPISACTAGYVRDQAQREFKVAEGHRRNGAFYLGLTQGLKPMDIIGYNVDPLKAEALRLKIFGNEDENSPALIEHQ